MCSFIEQLLYINRKSRKKKDFGGAPLSLDLSLQTKDFVVRILHAGGREELYQDAIPASYITEKYPGNCVARPEVFKSPHESLLGPEEKLLPGQKYFLIPCTTAQKLKLKSTKKVEVKETVEDEEEMSVGKMVANVGGDNLDVSICSAKEFYVSNERRSRCFVKQRGRGKKQPFVPPISKERLRRELGWEPSLTSVQELSP
ncbi:hypothetical protein L1049_005973 [Liquidambar formosana]|uniref:Uncharacterized protein n=1 Tax=Liquidambar formosana TaxID=63359 RepID=A0AAP0RGD4_LIQFO